MTEKNKELIVLGTLPEEVENTYLEQMEGASRTKQMSLTAVRNTLAYMIRSDDYDFRFSKIPKAAKKANIEGCPASQTFSNETSSHLRALVQSAIEACSDGNPTPKKVSSYRDIDIFMSEVKPLIKNAQIKRKLDILMNELDSKRHQVNILKSEYPEKAEPITFNDSTLYSAEQGQISVSSLSDNDVHAIKKFLFSLDSKLGGSPVYENEFGALETVEGDEEVAPAAFLVALRKIVSDHEQNN